MNTKRKTARSLENTLPDESAHLRSPLEWWFIHGHFGHGDSRRLYFMTTLFRHGFAALGKNFRNGYSQLLAVLDRETGKTWTYTKISRSLLQAVASLKDQNLKLNIESRLLTAFLDEIRENGAPREIRVSTTDARIHSSMLSALWDDFSLEQDSRAFRLAFTEPSQNRHCRFALSPLRPRLEIESVGNVKGHGRGMSYYCYPRLQLDGTLGLEKVTGEAWLDHQWGDFDWFITKKSHGRVLGWNWLGINLDDGSDWIVLVNTDAQNGTAVASHVTISSGAGKKRTFKNLSLMPVRYWESPKTAILHPVEWRLEVPQIKAELRFMPLVEDQEIPVFNLMRAIWEGAGHVEGTVHGKPVSGQARGEFQGYGYLFHFEDFLKSYVSRIDRHIEAFLPKTMDVPAVQKYAGPGIRKIKPTVFDEMLSEPVWDLLSRQGKRWRPIFGLLLLEALGTNPVPYESLVSVLAELPHTGALIIDDIEDDSVLRRGKECIHLRYGKDVAINAANTIYFLPTLANFDHLHLSENQKLEIQKIIMNQFVKAHLGQAMDLYWSRHMTEKNLKLWLKDSLEDEILQMYAFKTAAVIEGLAQIAAIIAGANESLKNTCANFARALGTAFQIVDDIHNFSPSPKWRKVRGEDIMEGKMTYVIYRALRSLRPSDAARLCKILGSKSLRKDKTIVAEGVELIRKSGILQDCRKKARVALLDEWRNLAACLKSSLSKILLNMLCSDLIELDLDS